MFHYFKQRKAFKAQAKALYDKAVERGRMPYFYENLAVPDTIDGRFELISLHNFMVMYGLQKEGHKKISQYLFDSFFVNMDRSLREIGIGDLGVPKHMKRMMQGFNGRCQSYHDALEANDIDMLKAALVRNVYGTVEKPTDDILTAMSDYIMRCVAAGTNEGEFAPLDMIEGEKKHA